MAAPPAQAFPLGKGMQKDSGASLLILASPPMEFPERWNGDGMEMDFQMEVEGSASFLQTLFV